MCKNSSRWRVVRRGETEPFITLESSTYGTYWRTKGGGIARRHERRMRVNMSVSVSSDKEMIRGAGPGFG